MVDIIEVLLFLHLVFFLTKFLLYRTHTVILIDAENNMDFFEETMIFSGSDNSDIQWEHTHIHKKF